MSLKYSRSDYILYIWDYFIQIYYMSDNETIKKAVDIVYLFTPMILSTFFVLLTLVNENFKGIIFIIGAILSTICYIVVSKFMGFECPGDSGSICKTFGLPFQPFPDVNSSGSSILFVVYTFIYILVPMLSHKQTNPLFIIMMTILVSINIYGAIIHKCMETTQIVVASFLGVICGFIWYAIIGTIDDGYFLYYDELISNNIQCLKPSRQTFRCKVYNNGQLDTSSI